MLTEKKTSIEQRARAAANFSTSTLDKEKGTVESVFATDTAVRMYDWDLGHYWEILGFEKNEVRLDRINTSAPILKNHRSYNDTLGTVEYAKVEDGKLVGKLRFDLEDVDGAKIFGKIDRGFVKSVSVGYKVHKYRWIEDREGLPVLRAIDWEPFEISTADIPADIKSHIKRTDENSVKNELIIEREMKTDTPTTELEKERIAQETKAKEAAIKSERERVAAIRTACRTHKMTDDFADDLIDKGRTVEETNAAILQFKETAEKAQNTRTTIVTVGNDKMDAKTRSLLMGDALLRSIDGNKFKLPKERQENPFVGKRLMDFVDAYLVERSLDTTGTVRERAKRAMMHGIMMRTTGQMTTSDFPLLFANVLNQVLRADYNFPTKKWLPLAFRQDASRINQPEKTIQLGDFKELELVLEGGEYKRQTIDEAGESFSVRKYGNTFAITLEMIVNDDYGAINRMIQKALRSNDFTEDYIVWGLINANPTMGDGTALYHADHANDDTPGALSLTRLSAMRQLIRKQTGLNGKTLDLTPKYIIAGTEYEELLTQLTSTNYVPTKTSDVVPNYIKNLVPIITSHITNGNYYMTADPMEIDLLRVGGLNGEPDFTVEENYEFNNDSFEHKMRKYFGAAYVDWRGWVRNTGV